MAWLRLVSVLSGRMVLGLLIGATLAMLGVGIGWGSYVFFGATSRLSLLIFLLVGAAIGATGGGFLAWLHLDYNTPVRLMKTAMLLLLAGIAGAWGGFQYGAAQEIPCCAKADLTPITYIVLGAAGATNLMGLMLEIAREMVPDRMRHSELDKVRQ